METLQNIWNFISDSYTQNTIFVLCFLGIICALFIVLLVIEILLNFNLKKQIKIFRQLVENKDKKISYLEKFQTINICEIQRLNAVISNYNSKFVEIESDNLPKRNIKTGRFEKRL
jgi:hypothetical protein